MGGSFSWNIGTELPEHSLETIRDRERRWLASHKLLDQPWFILASAPNPTIPPEIVNRSALICINNAGATAARIGLPPAGLTFRNSNKEWKSVKGCRLPLVLWLSHDWLRVIWTKMFVAPSVLGNVRMMPKKRRSKIYTEILGPGLENLGDKHKPSTGLFAITYGLFVGVPEITVGGISMEGDGYSYGTLPGVQRHRAEDRFSLGKIAEGYPSVRTTERDVSEQVGLPLVT